MRYQLYPHIVSDPDVQGGKPVIEGTQVPVSTLIAQVAAGKSLDEVAREQGIGAEDVRAALEFGAQQVDGVATTPASRSPVPTPEEVTMDLTDEELAAAEEEAKRLGLDPADLSPLGRRLLAIRAQSVASGEPLLSTWEELDAEIAERRGGHYPDTE